MIAIELLPFVLVVVEIPEIAAVTSQHHGVCPPPKRGEAQSELFAFSDYGNACAWV